MGHTSQTLQDKIKQYVPNLLVLATLPKNAFFLHFGLNLPPSLLLLIQSLDLILYKILSVLNIMMTVDFLKVTLLFIHLLLKPLLSNLPTPISATKTICVQLKNCALITLSYRSFSSQSQLVFFLQIAATFPALSILDNCS